MGRIRVLVADGHRIFAEALATALAAEPDVEVMASGSAQSAERALERAAAENRPFQVLLVDSDLGPGNGGPGNGGPGSSPGSTQTGSPGGIAAAGPGPNAGGSPGTSPGGDPRRPLTSASPPPRSAVTLPAQRSSSGNVPTPGLPSATSRLPVPRGPAAPGAGPMAGNSAATTGPPGLSGSGTDGIVFAARARAAHPALQIVVLAAEDDPRRVALALQAGARAWVAKESSLGRLMAVIRGVLRDETHIPPLLLTGVIRELTAVRRDRTESERLVESLTPREKQVLRCMVAGLGRQAVADRLYLSPHTVRTHMQNVLGKLGVHSTLAAVALARRAGVGPAEH